MNSVKKEINFETKISHKIPDAEMLRYTGLDRESKGCFLQNTPPKTPK
jgi:hypothetical protein